MSIRPVMKFENSISQSHKSTMLMGKNKKSKQ